MIRLRLAVLGLLGVWPLLAAAETSEPVRPELGTPLEAAQKAISERHYAEALQKIDEASHIKNQTPYEAFLVQELRGIAANGAGDFPTAIAAFQAILPDSHVSAAQRLAYTKSIAIDYYNSKDYAQAVVWGQRAVAAGAAGADIHTLLAQSWYFAGDYAHAATELTQQIAAAIQAGQTPSESQVLMLADTALKQGNSAQYTVDLAQILRYYPKKPVWTAYLHQIAIKPGFAERLQLDLDRLRLATGTLDNAPDYLETAQLALSGGEPGEARQVIEHGYAAGILGVGADIDRQNRLRALATRQASEDRGSLDQVSVQAAHQPDGTGLINVGLDYVGYGEAEKGAGLIEQGLQKGGLKHPEDAKLHLGIATLLAGNTNKAVQILGGVGGTDGTAELAQAWLLYARTKS